VATACANYIWYRLLWPINTQRIWKCSFAVDLRHTPKKNKNISNIAVKFNSELSQLADEFPPGNKIAIKVFGGGQITKKPKGLICRRSLNRDRN
jgi:hypothetical protein